MSEIQDGTRITMLIYDPHTSDLLCSRFIEHHTRAYVWYSGIATKKEGTTYTLDPSSIKIYEDTVPPLRTLYVTTTHVEYDDVLAISARTNEESHYWDKSPVSHLLSLWRRYKPHILIVDRHISLLYIALRSRNNDDLIAPSDRILWKHLIYDKNMVMQLATKSLEYVPKDILYVPMDAYIWSSEDHYRVLKRLGPYPNEKVVSRIKNMRSVEEIANGPNLCTYTLPPWHTMLDRSILLQLPTTHFDVHKYACTMESGYKRKYTIEDAYIPTVIGRDLSHMKEESHERCRLLQVVCHKYALIYGSMFMELMVNKHADVLQSQGMCEYMTRVHMRHLVNRPFSRLRPFWLKNPTTRYNLEVDLFNEDLKLAIEVDGCYHSKPDQKERDRIKEEILRNKGYKVFRVRTTSTPDTFRKKLDTLSLELKEYHSPSTCYIADGMDELNMRYSDWLMELDPDVRDIVFYRHVLNGDTTKAKIVTKMAKWYEQYKDNMEEATSTQREVCKRYFLLMSICKKSVLIGNLYRWTLDMDKVDTLKKAYRNTNLIKLLHKEYLLDGIYWDGEYLWIPDTNLALM